MATRDEAGGGTASARRRSVAMALAECPHPSAPRGQKKARAGEGYEMKYKACFWKNTLPQATGAQCFAMDYGEAPAAERAALLLEVLPQGLLGRHTGVGFELVLDPVVPQWARTGASRWTFQFALG